MRFGITTKLYLALLLTGVVLIILVAVAQRHSFRQGFLRYVNRFEVTQLESLTRALAAEHERGRGWGEFSGDPEHWHRFLHRSLRPGPRGHASDGRHDGPPPPAPWLAHRPPSPPRPAAHLIARLSLLDAERAPIAGNPDPPSTSALRPIRVEDRVVGWLAVAPAHELRSRRDLRFAREQRAAAAWIAAAAIILAALVAIPLARHLLKPVRELARATRTLAAGDLSARTESISGDELGQLGRDFNALAATLERNELSRRTFMADVSHELRTPLSVLRGELEALGDGLRPVTPAALQSLREEVRRLSKLVDDVYDLARSDLGALSFERTDVDIVDLLRRAVDAYRPQFDARPVAIEIDLPASAVSLHADPDRLRQLFDNLLENALRYTDPGGRARLRCKATTAVVDIDIEDSAPAVPAEQFDRLFERFFRVEASRSRAHGGAGLGLAICRGIVAGHGGRITAHASSLGGLWIRVSLPVTRTDDLG